MHPLTIFPNEDPTLQSRPEKEFFLFFQILKRLSHQNVLVVDKNLYYICNRIQEPDQFFMAGIGSNPFELITFSITHKTKVMKKTILLSIMAVAMTTSAFSEQKAIPMQTHQTGSADLSIMEARTPINLPISVYYDSDTNILEVWCADDNIQAEVYVYDDSGTVEAYSPYMNVALQLTPYHSHSILIKGDGWEAEGGGV